MDIARPEPIDDSLVNDSGPVKEDMDIARPEPIDNSLVDDSSPVKEDMDIARLEPIDNSFGDDSGPVVEDFDITRAEPIALTVIFSSCYYYHLFSFDKYNSKVTYYRIWLWGYISKQNICDLTYSFC